MSTTKRPTPPSPDTSVKGPLGPPPTKAHLNFLVPPPAPDFGFQGEYYPALWACQRNGTPCYLRPSGLPFALVPSARHCSSGAREHAGDVS